MKATVITRAQSRAARALLDITQIELAMAADVGKQTVIDFESGARVSHDRNVEAIRQALETAGIVFLGRNGVKIKPQPVRRKAVECRKADLGLVGSR